MPKTETPKKVTLKASSPKQKKPTKFEQRAIQPLAATQPKPKVTNSKQAKPQPPAAAKTIPSVQSKQPVVQVQHMDARTASG